MPANGAKPPMVDSPVLAMDTPTSTPTHTATPIPTLTPTSTPTLTSTPTPTVTSLPLTLLTIKIPAPALAKNLLDEPVRQAIQIYLPPTYSSSELRYPVIYFLPGFGSDARGDVIGYIDEHYDV